MRFNTKPPKVEDGVQIPAEIVGAFNLVSSKGIDLYKLKFLINENDSYLSVDKIYIRDFVGNTELTEDLKQLKVIDENGIYDDANLPGTEVKVILETTEYNGKPQKNVKKIIV